MKPGAYEVTWRDRLGYRLSCVALWLATPTYREFCHWAWLYGVKAAARDEREGRPPPDLGIGKSDPMLSLSWLAEMEKGRSGRGLTLSPFCKG